MQWDSTDRQFLEFKFFLLLQNAPTHFVAVVYEESKVQLKRIKKKRRKITDLLQTIFLWQLPSVQLCKKEKKNLTLNIYNEKCNCPPYLGSEMKTALTTGPGLVLSVGLS